MVNWANLEAYPLSLVLDKLEEHIDHVRFSVVCKTWLSVANINHTNHQFRINVPPMLMILSDRYYRIHTISQTKKRSLYSILSEKEYPIQLSHPSIIESKTCMGCSHGWLALVDDNNAITLVNPFKCSVAPISLPPLESVYKVTLSADPITSPNDYVVAAIYSCGSLAFKRASQSFWIRVNKNGFHFTHVVFYKGLIFADSLGNNIVSFKFNNPPSDDSNDPNFTYFEKIASTPYTLSGQRYYSCRVYFMKSLTGDLWMVRRYKVDKHSFKLHVHKLQLDTQSGKLEQMSKLESLENNILFVANQGDSISLSASCFSRLEKDSIYFVNQGNQNDLGLEIYNVKDGSFQRQSLPLSFEWMQVFWVQPQFQWDSPVHL